ncbi:uncharacterized protein [Palaemon carinicauda]|uniref:uncharacterized protein n=1 Tax=Palaemon carinicauda TaxID=392227 RepID=UPI0035B5CD21
MWITCLCSLLPKKNTAFIYELSPTAYNLTAFTVKFLDMINYHHRFLPAIAATLAHFHASLKGKPNDLKWGALQEIAFCNTNNTLSTAAALPFLVLYALLFFSIDAIDVSVGAVFFHVVKVLSCPLAFSVENCPRQNPITPPLTA